MRCGGRTTAGGRKVATRIAKLLAGLFFMSGLLARCAYQVAPQGGPRDTLPPVVTGVEPAYGTINFKGRRVLITFDEYVVLKDLQKEFFISPFMSRRPAVVTRGRGIQVDIPDSLLLPETTYSLNFGSSVQDNNEGNPLRGLRYVFSTGGHIDSLVVSGYAADAQRGDSVGGVYIMFYPDADEPLTEGYDSTLFNLKAQSVARTMPNGTFLARNLRPVAYRVYAFQDNNGNQLYEPGTDRVAFMDSLIDPTRMPDFEAWFDTTRMYTVPQPQMMFRVFMDEAFKRQWMTGAKRTAKNKVELYFNAPHPSVDTLRLDGLDEGEIIREYPTPGRDTVFLWLDVPAERLSDTITGRVAYMRHDSLNNLAPVGTDLRLGWFEREETREERRAREELEQQIEEAVANGETPPARPNPFKYEVRANSELNPEDNIVFVFEYPLSSIDSGAIRLVMVEGERESAVKAALRQDSVGIRKWTLSAPWITDKDYHLTIPAGALTDIAGRQNDTLRSRFRVASPDKFATLIVNVTGKTPRSQYTLQVTTTSGSVIKEVRNATTGSYEIRYIPPGDVRLRVLEDANGNGVWDRGNLISRTQPELIEIFVDDAGKQDISLRAGWEQTLDVDMSLMFAPMTMERLNRMLDAQEAERARKALEQQQQMRNQPQRQQPTSGAGMFGGGGGASGMPGLPGLPGLPGFNR